MEQQNNAKTKASLSMIHLDFTATLDLRRHSTPISNYYCVMPQALSRFDRDWKPQAPTTKAELWGGSNGA